MWEQVNQSGSVAQRIVVQIEKLLDDGTLKPGDQLPTERDLARLVGASRPTVREAVRILQARGKVEVKHGVGVFVTEPPAFSGFDASLQRQVGIDELFSMREVLEVPAASWAAKVATIDDAFEADPADFRQLARLDASFHLTIADVAANRFLQQISRVLHEILIAGMETTLLIPGRREQSRTQHAQILRALADGDAGAAARAARSHVRSARRAAQSRVASSGTA